MSNLFKYCEFLGTVQYSAEDEVFYGKILGVDDLVTFEGSSVRELKKAFKDAVDDYINACNMIGKSAQKSYKGTFNVRMPIELHKKAAAVAEERGISLNELVKLGLEKIIN